MEWLKYGYKFILYGFQKMVDAKTDGYAAMRVKARDPNHQHSFRRNRAVCLSHTHITKFCSNKRRLNLPRAFGCQLGLGLNRLRCLGTSHML